MEERCARGGCERHRQLGRRARERGAVLVDLENIAGPFRAGRERPDRALRRAWSVVNGLVRPVWSVAACHRRLARHVVLTAHDCGIRVYPGAPGPDRADRELIERAKTDIPSDVECLVLVSGDGDFVPLVRQQRGLGRHVLVVSRLGSLSAELTRAADEVHTLDGLEKAA